MHTHILVVDDNLIQGTTRRTILNLYFEKVTHAQEVRHALELLREPDPENPVSLIVTDHLMPEMNGPEFVRSVRKFLPAIPVVVLSGFSEVLEEYAGLNIIFRSKPFPPEELVRLCQELLQHPISRTA
jgi:CheY-like chemotaxis protein